MSEQERIKQEERIKRLAHEILPSLGHNNGSVYCPKDVGVDYVDEVGIAGPPILKWTIRATDDQKQTCLIEVQADPDETDEQIKKKLVESFSTVPWEPAPGQSNT